MHGQIVVSGGDRLRVFDARPPVLRREIPLASAGALCAGKNGLFCAADGEGVVYRFDPSSFLPVAVFAGGPGMRALCLSKDERFLYILLSDADSVMMLDGVTGAPMMLARVGVNPQSLRLDETGSFLVIAGGEDGCAYLLCSQTLRFRQRFQADGICCDALAHGDALHALMLTQTLHSSLSTWKDGKASQLILPGMPGALLGAREGLVVAAGKALYLVCADGSSVLRAAGMQGRAGKMLCVGEEIARINPFGETLCICGRDGVEVPLCGNVRDAAVLNA